MTAGEIDENVSISSELTSLIENDYGVKLQVFSEDDQGKYDPKNKARIARPYKPAILIE
jgi:leucyl-tRNA synthetase